MKVMLEVRVQVTRADGIRVCAILLAIAVILWPVGVALGQEVEDFTTTPLKELGVAPIKAKKDAKTGFLVGGVNTTELIRKLTEINGQSIADLEAIMRPGNFGKKEGSNAGFLGKDEKLLDVLAADNDFVLSKHKLNHQDVALQLNIVSAIGLKKVAQKGVTFRYHGQRMHITLVATRGYQHSPFKDGTKTNTDGTIENLDNGKKLKYSLLVPQMIER